MISTKDINCKSQYIELQTIPFRWIIYKPRLLNTRNSHENLRSELFTDRRFQLELYFTSDMNNYSRSYNSTCLNVRLRSGLNNDYQKQGCFKINIDEGSKYSARKDFTSFNLVELQLMTYDELQDSNNGYMIGDSLTLLFTIEIYNKNNIIELPTSKLSKDFGALLDTKVLSDVTIVTGDNQKIPAHKLILSARSKVFAAMFKHPMKESEENCVTIKEFSSIVLRELLRFIYSGEAPNLNGMIAELTAAADKYQIDELKAMCEKAMNEQLSIENAPVILKISDLYNMKDLKAKSIVFIKNNVQKVTETAKWKNLIKTDRMLILESFIDPQLLDSKLKDNNV